MAISIGPKGWVDLWSSDVGPKRRVRILSIKNPALGGDVYHPFVDAGMQPVAMINVKDGKGVSAYVSDTGTETGYVKVTDTGADVTRVGDTGDTLWVIYTDTGV